MITVGNLLKKKRQEKKLAIEQVEKELLVRKKYLIAVERGNWKIFPSRVYAQGVVKNYAKFLKLEEAKIMAYFRREYDRFEKIEFREKKIKENFIEKLQRNTNITLSILTFIFISFIGFQLYLYLRPPYVKIIQPKDANATTKKNAFIIKGQAEKDSQVLINNQSIKIDKKGMFSYKVPLFDGENKFLIKVIGSNGKTTEKEVVIKKQ